MEFKRILAARLFELRKVTFLQAAKMAGLDAWQFTDLLKSLGTSPVNLTEEDLLNDIARS